MSGARRYRIALSMAAVAAFACVRPSHAFAQERITLRITDWASLEEIPLDRQAIALFEERHPEIRVLLEPNPGRQYEEKILTGLAAGDAPDVFLLDSKLVPTFTNKHILLDLTPYVERLRIDTAQWFPNVLAIARRDRALYAFPKGFTPLMVFYNRRLFREAGITEPRKGWDWSEYLDDARALTRDRNGDGKPDQYGTSFTNYYYSWIPWVWTGGGDVVNEDGRSATGALNAARTEEALQFLIDLRSRHRVAPDAGSWVQAEKTGLAQQMFLNGSVAMTVSGHWALPSCLLAMRSGRLELGVAPIPKHPDGRSVNVLYESGWCVPVNAKHPREAVLLAAFMAGPEAARIRATQMLEIPSVITVAHEVVRTDTTGVERAFVDEVPVCRQPWGSRIERFSEIEWTLQDAVDEVLLNRRPIHETMTRYAARIDAQLAEIHRHESLAFTPIEEHTEVLGFLAGTAFVVTAGCATCYVRARRRERQTARTAIAFLAPSLLHLTVFIATPIAYAAYLSVHRWDLIVPDKPFVGFDNFRELAGDPSFLNALGNTFIYALNVPAGMILALAVALMLHRTLRGAGFLRTLYFLPSVTSFVAIALVWMWIYHPTFGAANYILSLAGLPPLQWLNATQTAMASVMIFTVWMGVGYQVVIFLAGLQGISEEYYEVARMDGASPWQRFRSITFPLLLPTTFFVLVTSLISSFQVFTSIYVMTAGGPVGSTDVLVYHVYQSAWEQLRIGYASAMSWVLFVIIMAVTWMQFRLLRNTGVFE